MSRRLEQPVALVTGAGRGIGAGVAAALSNQGYAVALTSRSRDQLEETAAGCAGPTLVLPADLTAPGAIDDVVDRVEQEWAAPEVVVANAGAAAWAWWLLQGEVGSDAEDSYDRLRTEMQPKVARLLTEWHATRTSPRQTAQSFAASNRRALAGSSIRIP